MSDPIVRPAGRASHKDSELLARNEVLRNVFASGQVPDGTDNPIPETTGIQLAYAEALYRLVRQRRPSTILEVGMACGASTLVMLTALVEGGQGGRLISVDPYQATTWQSIGVLQVRRCGLDGFHTVIQEPDYLALPDLLRYGTRLDFVYIDGWHTFDYTLLDCCYADRMLEPGGVVGFNDCKYRAVRRVISFRLSHRDDRELDVGIAPDFLHSARLWKTLRRLTGWTVIDRYFEKRCDWEPDWSFYARF
jgi:predicted O-methyltransferase YrrM